MNFKKSAPIILVLSLICLDLSAQEEFNPELYKTQSVFSLNGHTINAESSFAMLTDEFFSGQTNALMIEFFAGPLNEQGAKDILANHNGREFFRNKEHAILVLFIDKGNRIWQVNLTQIIPGNTVVYTVAGNTEELKRFSDYAYDGKNLKLKSQGSYKPADYPSTLTWDVNVDIPVQKKLNANSGDTSHEPN